MSKRFEKWGTTEIIQDKRWAWSLEKICDYLNENFDKIADLEAKLAEAQGKIEGRKNLCYLRYKQLETQDKEIKTHDREKDKRIKELEQKVQELQEVDNKRAFRLYCMLYDMLEEKDPENVASRIDYLTGKDYSEMCELYKTAKNLKQHDRELVKEVCEKIKEQLGFIVDGQERIVCDGSATGDKTILAVLNQIQKEFEK